MDFKVDTTYLSRGLIILSGDGIFSFRDNDHFRSSTRRAEMSRPSAIGYNFTRTKFSGQEPLREILKFSRVLAKKHIQPYLIIPCPQRITDYFRGFGAEGLIIPSRLEEILRRLPEPIKWDYSHLLNRS